MAIINLMDLEPQKISRNLKGKYIFAYGPPKIGKTTLIASFPKSLVLCFEPGVNALDGIYAQPVLTWTEFKSVLRELKKPEVQEKFDFIGIDTVDIAYELCETYICKQHNVENLGDLAWGKGYSLLAKEFASTFRQIAQLGYGMIFISHTVEKILKDNRGMEFTQIQPAAPTRAKDIVNKLVDFIIYIGVDYSKEHPEGKRIMQLQGSKEVVAGSRFPDVPEKIEFGYETLRDTIVAAVDRKVGANSNMTTENQSVFYKETNLRPFKDCMKEAEEVWIAIANKSNTEETSKKVNKIITNNFNRNLKLSQVQEPQQELLEATIFDLKELLASL